MLFVPSLLGSFLACTPGAAGTAGDVQSFEQALHLLFPDARAGTRRTVLSLARSSELEKRLRSGRVPPIVSYSVLEKDGGTLGYAVQGECLGRSEPISYCIALNPDLSVRAVEVLAYRESHGGEIRNPAFRNQFVGKTAADALQVGKDVRNIAGATISCHSLTDAVHDQLVLLGEVLAPAAATSGPGAAPGAPGAAASSPRLPARARLRRTQLHMGTLLQIVAHGPDAATLAGATDRAFAEVRRLEQLFSRFLPGSEVARLNVGAGGDWRLLSRETTAVLALARTVSRESQGAFDVTIGALQGTRRGQVRRPSLACRARVGSEVLEMEGDRARLRVPGAAVDLGGIGKGFALESAAAVLRSCGVPRALLDFGGQLLALEPPPGEQGWWAGWRDPSRPATLAGLLFLDRESAATSAAYERGRSTPHLLDPRTGASRGGILGVTVVGPRAALADAWSTALFVLGPEEGISLADRQGLAARFDTSRGSCWNRGWTARACDPEATA